MAVEKVIGYAIENDWNKDLLILTDNQEVVKDVKDNKLNYNKHRIVSRIREKVFEYTDKAKNRDNRDVKVTIG